MNGGKDIMDQTLAHSNANTTSWPARDNSHSVALLGGDGPYPEVIAQRVGHRWHGWKEAFSSTVSAQHRFPSAHGPLTLVFGEHGL